MSIEHNPNRENNSSLIAKLRFRAGILAGVAAIAGAEVVIPMDTARATGKDYGIGLVGFSDESIFTENLKEAEDQAARIEAMGGTAVRFFYTVNKGTAWPNYVPEVCHAFQAAYDHHLQPIVVLTGADENGRGFVPSSNKDMQQAATSAASIIWTVASNKDKDHPGGCVPQQKNFIIEGYNEPNGGPAFNTNVGPQTPAQTLKLDYKISRALQKTAARPEIQATVSYGESLAVSNHDIVGFLSDQAQAAEDLNIPNPYNFIDAHPYPANTTEDPVATMRRLKPQLQNIINSSFKGAKLVWGEYGINTINPPASEAGNYSPAVGSNIGVSESTQVKYVSDYLKEAAVEDTPWVTLFDVEDDGSGYMPSSGVYYADKDGSGAVPKSSQGPIRYQIGKYTGR